MSHSMSGCLILALYHQKSQAVNDAPHLSFLSQEINWFLHLVQHLYFISSILSFIHLSSLCPSCCFSLCPMFQNPGSSHPRGPAYPPLQLEVLPCVCVGRLCLLLLALSRGHLLRVPCLTTCSWGLSPQLISTPSATPLLHFFILLCAEHQAKTGNQQWTR